MVNGVGNPEREAERINAWAAMQDARTYELRSGNEIVETFDPCETLGNDVCQAAAEDCEIEGRLRKYKVVGVAEDGQQYICPLVIRRRPERVVSDNIVASLTRQNTELHARLLEKDDKALLRVTQALETVSEVAESASRQVSEVRKREEEVFAKLEELRTMALERDIMKERHEKNIETQERITDAVLPLGMAIAKKLTAGDGKANKMLDEPALVQVCKGMQPEQLDVIRQILGDELGHETDAFITQAAIDGGADVDRFKALVGRMTHDQLMRIVGTLNMGQQAALKEVLEL